MDNETKNEYLGYFKYQGKLIKNGYLGAKSSANALLGIDEVMKYFLSEIDPQLKELDFSIPVKVQEGSWEALIPKDIEQWVLTGAGTGFTIYLSTALKKMAEHDFEKVGFLDIIKKSFKAIKWVIKIASHLKSLSKKVFENAQIKEDDGLIFVGIPDDKNNYLFVPEEYIQFYVNCPEKLFSKLTRAINKDIKLEIGLNQHQLHDKDDLFKEVTIGIEDKYVYTKDETIDDVIFPDLKHNDFVELEGHVTRGNENTNTIGFEYKNHILVCIPVVGNIKQHKSLLFTNCLIKGYVDRTDKDGSLGENKPKIKFTDLIQLETNSTSQTKLL